MKKRVMLLLCTIGVVCSLSACQNAENGTNEEDAESFEELQQEVEENKVDSVENESNNEKITVAGEEYDVVNFFNHLYMDPYFRFQMNLPGFNGSNANSPDLEARSMRIYISDYSGDVENAFSDWDKNNLNLSNYEDSTDIFDVLFPEVCYNQFPSDADVEYTVEIVSTEEINGVEMTKFTGEVTYSITETTDDTYPFVAYGIKGAKTPILIFGYDTGSEGVSYYEDVVKIVEYMVTTYKDEVKIVDTTAS